MFFEADEEQIARLQSLDLVRLMKRLLHAECRLIDIPLRATTVPLQITVADGGEDGRVDWSGGADSTDYFPGRFSIFQSKAQNLTEKLIAAEVLKKPKKGAAKLNAAVLEAVSRRGSYIVFCSRKCTGQKIKKLKNAIEKAVRKGKRKPSNLKSIEIYDANRIADWVNTHPPVALWLASLSKGRSLTGFLSHEAWGRADDIRRIPWIADETSRFSHNQIKDSEIRPDGSNAVWTFEEAAAAALDWLGKDQPVLRLAGPSGFGKSRFAYEMFNQQTNVSGEVDRTVLIYADLAIVGGEVAKLALEIADAGSSAILVVDDCPDDFHSKLSDITRRAGSRLRLVTIDVETKVQDTLVIRLEPASDRTIGSIASSVAPSLTASDSRFIQEFAKGFPKMAILAAKHNGRSRPTIGSAGEILNRVVWGRRQRIEEAQKALELLSLFEWVGLGGRVTEEGKLIAENLGTMTQDAFVEHINSFTSRGIIVQREESYQVSPIPLAVVLATDRLKLIKEKLLSFFLEAPLRLKISLLRRLRWLDTSQEAKAFARTLLTFDYLGNLETLNTEGGAECLDHLVHVDPDLVMATIHRVFDGLNSAELHQVSEGRRYLVWALEKLAFRKETFDGAATLLRRLAASETEGDISNNATGQFTQLYQLYLSGTEAPPAMRFLVLDDGLRSSNAREREVCIVALNKMLETGHYSRSGGAEEVGSERLKDWEPSIYGEILDFLRAALKRLTDIALSTDHFAPQAKNIIGSHIRGLIGKLPLEELKATISRILLRDGFWPKAVEKVNEWLYFDRRKAPQDLGREVRAYFDELMPADSVEQAILYTHGWQSDFHDPDIDYDQESSGHDYEYMTRKAIELADLISKDLGAIDRTLEHFVASEGKNVFPFARRLAELAPSVTAMFKTAVERIEHRQEAANLDFFGGLIAGADLRDAGAARECIQIVLGSTKLKPDVISMIRSSKLQRSDIALVVSLLQSGDIKPSECSSLSYGRGLAHLEGEDVLPLLMELSQNGSEGLLAVIDIVTMLLHGGGELTEGILSVLQTVLVDQKLFDSAEKKRQMGYEVDRVIKYLVRRNLIKVQFAKALVKQLLNICTPARANVFHELCGPVRDSLRAIIDQYPLEVWTNVAKLLVSTDVVVRHRIEQLVMTDHDNYMGPGLLFEIPADIYIEWTRKDSAHRASIVMRWLPITTKTKADSLAWHPALESFISQFGNEPAVLGALSRRLQPMSSYGSLKPHIEPQIKLLESWTSHPQPKVRQWARERINFIRSQA
ncbi:MAG: hypothetical protein OEW32_15545 [Nitrospira sp.]|nr:hypothetical protein [Nitrospira sp.]